MRISIVRCKALHPALAGVAPTSAPAPSVTPSPLVSHYDLTQLGFDANAPLTISGAQIDSGTAVAIAEQSIDSTPVQVIHSRIARVSPAGVGRTVWIVVFAARASDGNAPGPAPAVNPPGQEISKAVVDYTGVVVDDQTGAVVQTFKGGHQQ
jgi:hypothetical protein